MNSRIRNFTLGLGLLFAAAGCAPRPAADSGTTATPAAEIAALRAELAAAQAQGAIR